MNRRGFLRFLAVAPVAAPVIASGAIKPPPAMMRFAGARYAVGDIKAERLIPRAAESLKVNLEVDTTSITNALASIEEQYSKVLDGVPPSVRERIADAMTDAMFGDDEELSGGEYVDRSSAVSFVTA